MNKRSLAMGLALAMACSAVVPAMAYTYKNSEGKVVSTQDFTDNEPKANCTVYAEVGSSFKVTIPKHIIMSGKDKTGGYTINVTGDIAGDQFVKVVPAESFPMEQPGKANVTTVIKQETTMFRGANYVPDVDGTTTVKMNDTVDAEGKEVQEATGYLYANGEEGSGKLTAGAWNGNFDFAISLEGGDAPTDAELNGPAAVVTPEEGSEG